MINFVSDDRDKRRYKLLYDPLSSIFFQLDRHDNKMSTTNKPTALTADIQRVKLHFGNDVFYVYAEPGKAALFKKNPSMPLTDVVEVFEVFEVLEYEDVKNFISDNFINRICTKRDGRAKAH